MKKGLIVYLVDSNSLPETFDEREALDFLSLDCDHSMLAASHQGYHDIQDAWHLMLTRGMQHISCIKARLSETGSIELYGEPFRLYG